CNILASTSAGSESIAATYRLRFELFCSEQEVCVVATRTGIEWTELTWNPVAGCTVLSPGCTNCYAMRMAARLAAMGIDKYAGTTRLSGGRHKWNGQVNLDRATLGEPFRWKRPRLVFVNSMSDLFHEDVPLAFIEDVFRVIRDTPRHTYQVLTKRA